MKKLIFLGLLFFVSVHLLAQRHSDSIAYQAERKTINAMLAQRAQKFGQYDQSLSKHTGIFGLQTKKDIRNSNDILMDIVKTDNDIYKEIKILLDFRAFQQTQAQTKVKETEDNTIGYMTAINKLRKQVDDLKAEADQSQREAEKSMRMFMISLAIALIALALLVFRRKRVAKR
jgi:hypothetical protein